MHALFVVFDLFYGKDLASLILARGIADARCATSHEHNWLATSLLQPVQHHDGDEAANMQRECGTVVADVGHDFAPGRDFPHEFIVIPGLRRDYPEDFSKRIDKAVSYILGMR